MSRVSFGFSNSLLSALRTLYSKTPTGKASKGSVSIINSNGRLQLRFRHAGERHYISWGFSDTPQNRKLAEMRTREIELDILARHFDDNTTLSSGLKTQV